MKLKGINKNISCIIRVLRAAKELADPEHMPPALSVR